MSGLEPDNHKMNSFQTFTQGIDHTIDITQIG